MIFIKRHIGIQRTVFLSPGCGNRRIHLPVDTQSGKAEKGGSLLSIISLHRLKEADHSPVSYTHLAISSTDILLSYSLTVPSFNVIFIVFSSFLFWSLFFFLFICLFCLLFRFFSFLHVLHEHFMELRCGMLQG